jgi:hypothetical protein
MHADILAFGARDAVVTPWTDSTTLSTTPIHGPRIMTAEANVTRDSTDLEADDVKVATHTFAKGLEGSLELGGLNLAILAVLEGGVVTTTGMTPNRIGTYEVEGDQTEGYFKLEVQIYDDGGGDAHFIGWRMKATNGPNYNFTQGEFALTQCDIAGTFDESVSPSRLYSLIGNETVTVIDMTP